MKQRKVRSRNVIVALWMNGASGRGVLAGVLRHANAHGWTIRLIQNADELTPDAVAAAKAGGTDGFLIGVLVRDAAVRRLLDESEIPLVSMDNPELCQRPKTVLVRTNDRAIGKDGAQYLLSLGSFRSFGFVPDMRRRNWSNDRLDGFRSVVEAAGQTLRVFDSPLCDPTGDQTADVSALREWLLALPKPAAVMAAWDFRATNVLEACKAEKIGVPGQVAVLGVDDDGLLCMNSEPRLSSIKLDYEAEGAVAAKALDALMAGRTAPATVFCGVPSVVERETTRPIAPSARLVHRALAFIKNYACKGAKVSDVVAHLGVSRRLADLRFRELQDTSIGKALERRRLEEARRLLAGTAWPMRRIAKHCGFSSPNRLSHVFKSAFGISMREFRRRG